VIANDMERMNNISSTFEFKSLTCVVCNDNHALSDQYGRCVIMLGDQTLPPAAPAVNGNLCIGIVRVEDGNPLEIAGFFCDTLADKIGKGSVILLSAGTYLARCGIASYTADLASACRLIADSLHSGCKVTAGPFLPILGTKDFGWISAMADLAAWVVHGETDDTATMYLSDSHETMMAIIRDKKTGGSWLGTPARAILPRNLSDREPTVFQVGEGRIILPTATSPITETDEKRLFDAIRSELAAKHKLKIPELRFDRQQLTSLAPKDPRDTGVMLIVGGGTARRLVQAAKDKNMNAVLVNMESITADETKRAAEAIVKELQSLSDYGLNESSVIITALESCAYRYRTDEDEVIKGKQDDGGNIHYPGEVVMASENTYLRALEQLRPLLVYQHKTPAVILMPVPKFLNGLGCCNDTAHVKNRGSEKLKDDSFKTVANMKNAVNRELIKEKMWGVKALSSHPTLRTELSKSATPEESPDLGNYMPLQRYGLVLDETVAMLEFIRNKNLSLDRLPDARVAGSRRGGAPPASATADYADRWDWQQRFQSLDKKRGEKSAASSHNTRTYYGRAYNSDQHTGTGTTRYQTDMRAPTATASASSRTESGNREIAAHHGLGTHDIRLSGPNPPPSYTDFERPDSAHTETGTGSYGPQYGRDYGNERGNNWRDEPGSGSASYDRYRNREYPYRNEDEDRNRDAGSSGSYGPEQDRDGHRNSRSSWDRRNEYSKRKHNSGP